MIIPASHLRSIVDHDGAIILDIPQDAMLTLNATAGYVWERLAQGKQVDQIIADLAAESEICVEVVERDVRALIEQLKDRRLLVEMESYEKRR